MKPSLDMRTVREILSALERPAGFRELMRRTSLSSKTLSRYLKFLVSNKLVEKHIELSHPIACVRYVITPRGRDLLAILRTLVFAIVLCSAVLRLHHRERRQNPKSSFISINS